MHSMNNKKAIVPTINMNSNPNVELSNLLTAVKDFHDEIINNENSNPNPNSSPVRNNTNSSNNSVSPITKWNSVNDLKKKFQNESKPSTLTGTGSATGKNLSFSNNTALSKSVVSNQQLPNLVVLNKTEFSIDERNNNSLKFRKSEVSNEVIINPIITNTDTDKIVPLDATQTIQDTNQGTILCFIKCIDSLKIVIFVTRINFYIQTTNKTYILYIDNMYF